MNRFVRVGLGVGAAVVLALAPAFFVLGGFAIGLALYDARRRKRQHQPTVVLPPPNFGGPSSWYDQVPGPLPPGVIPFRPAPLPERFRK